ncbi:MAG: MotA/TolQ/ExbB proton channel family protein [Deltaproteobacteria bacterium]|nr:MotA/TolQ/ExbB proton channel family protein [Deltaproteobacteria bacterium]
MPTQAPLGREGLEAQLLDLFLFVGSEWVLYVLLILSVVSIAITIERALHFSQRSASLDALHNAVGAELAAGRIDEARRLLGDGRSHVATIVLSGLSALPRGAAAVEETMAGITQVERLKMERGLAFLGTLGNNAPFVGLFGTVLGIIRSFRDLSAQVTDTSAVMAGIAEALVATAVGLLVALPAVAVFNTFQRRIRKELVASEAMTRLVLAHAKSEKP